MRRKKLLFNLLNYYVIKKFYSVYYLVFLSIEVWNQSKSDFISLNMATIHLGSKNRSTILHIQTEKSHKYKKNFCHTSHEKKIHLY